jgi:hypothetical protein
MLAGGLGAGALIALPDLSVAGGPASTSPLSKIAPSGQRYALLYGTLPKSSSGGQIAPAVTPTSKAKSLPPATPVAVSLACAPVLSPDQSSVALITVNSVTGGSTVTLTLVNSSTAAIEKQGTLTVKDIPNGTNIIATPVFAPGTPTIAVVLGITEPTGHEPAVKKGTGVHFQATTWQSHHVLAYFDTSTGAFAGPFNLNNGPALALHSAAANGSDLFLWTTPEPQITAVKGTASPLPAVSAFPLGSGTARLTVPSPAPWPAHEPVVTLASGDVARFVNGNAVQVVSAQTGDVTQSPISALSARPAKPSSVTMTTRPDGTLLLVKPGIGRAVVADPAASFNVKSQVDFPVPAVPAGGLAHKAVLSASSETLYVLGPAKTGGLAAYDVATGKMTASFSKGSTSYTGLSLLSSGNLLAITGNNPRLAYFSPTLEPLGTANSTLQITAVF